MASLFDYGPLFTTLREKSEDLSRFAFVIIGAAKALLNKPGPNDYSHSEAIEKRIGELLGKSAMKQLSASELFILIAASYLHDIDKDQEDSDIKHGKRAADRIRKGEEFRHLFPFDDMRKQVEDVCELHDAPTAVLKKCSHTFNLDNSRLGIVHLLESERKVRVGMLAGIFRLADELECISMRMKLHGAKADDPRNAISGVRIDAEGKKIFLAFHRDTTPTKQSVCKHYLGNALLSVRTLLKPHGLSYRQTQTLSPSVEQGASSREEKAAYVKAQSYDIPAASNEEGQGSSKAPIRDIEKVLGRIQYHRLATIRTTALLGLVRRV